MASYKCPICNKIFSNYEEYDNWGMLINHLRNKHREELETTEVQKS